MSTKDKQTKTNKIESRGQGGEEGDGEGQVEVLESPNEQGEYLFDDDGYAIHGPFTDAAGLFYKRVEPPMIIDDADADEAAAMAAAVTQEQQQQQQQLQQQQQPRSIAGSAVVYVIASVLILAILTLLVYTILKFGNKK